MHCVCLFDLSEKNDPPEANAGGPYTVRYPETEKILDGSRSTDDYGKGMKYSWTQTRYVHNKYSSSTVVGMGMVPSSIIDVCT